MNIKIPEPSKKALEKNGWDCRGKVEPLYFKKVNNYSICVRFLNYGLTHECWVVFGEVATPDDLIAVANELKKLEEK